MVDLKCEREDCKFNKCCNCTANGIDVANNTTCTTYEKSKKPKHEQDRIPQALVRHNTNVRCGANCLFESECHCIANGITVENLKLSPNTCNCSCQNNSNLKATDATPHAGGTASKKTNGDKTAGAQTFTPQNGSKIWPTCTCSDISQCDPCCSTYLPK